MSDERNEEASSRLVDIVPEEVSLVDLAANKRRFLIVKREGGLMSDAGAAGRDEAKDGSANDEALDVALTAVEGLCEATLVLSEHAQSEAEVARVVALASEVESLAASLTEAPHASAPAQTAVADPPAGAPAPAASPEAPAASAAPAGAAAAASDGGASESTSALDKPSVPTEKRDSLNEAFSDVEQVLGAVRDVVAKARPAAPIGARPNPSAPVSAAPAARSDGEPTLATVMGAIGALTAAVQAQSERVARLEKNVGVPNSQPVNERPVSPPSDEDVSWPMDLNLRLDRGSVDKRLSFHE